MTASRNHRAAATGRKHQFTYGASKLEPWRYKDDANNGFILVSDKEEHYKNCLRKKGLGQ